MRRLEVISWLAALPGSGLGSEVVVLTKDLSHPTDKVALFGAIAQILASSVAIIAIATNL